MGPLKLKEKGNNNGLILCGKSPVDLVLHIRGCVLGLSDLYLFFVYKPQWHIRIELSKTASNR